MRSTRTQGSGHPELRAHPLDGMLLPVGILDEADERIATRVEVDGEDALAPRRTGVKTHDAGDHHPFLAPQLLLDRGHVGLQVDEDEVVIEVASIVDPDDGATGREGRLVIEAV